MSYFKTPPIPLLEASSERELMARFLFGTKHIKGLTTALVQTAGVKSKWLKPDEPRNIPAKRLLRIVLHTMHFLGREECKQRAYAQLRDEYYDGFAYWFSKPEEERMKQQNEYFRIVSDEEQLIRCRFRKPKAGEPFKRLNSATIAQMISYGRQPITSRRVSLVMKAIGFHSERNSKGCYYKLYEMDPNESQRVISDMLAEPEIEEKKPEPTQPDLFARYNDPDDGNDDLPF